MARQKGRFVDLCPNAGKCDYSPDQKIGGEIINLDTAEIQANLGAADLGRSDIMQNMRYDALQRWKETATADQLSAVGNQGDFQLGYQQHIARFDQPVVRFEQPV